MAYFNEAADFQERLAGQLKRASWAALVADAPFWAAIAAAAQRNAYDQIVAALAARGFSAAQTADWDAGASFESDLALFFALTEGGALENYDSKFLEKLDRREELKAYPVTVGGAKASPAGVPAVSFGYASKKFGSFHRSVNSAGDEVTSHKW